MTMRTLAVVPARGGSRRVERKNLERLGGTTLVRRALETALAARCFAAVVLSSDDRDILAETSGLDVVAVTRPAELAAAGSRTLDAVLHALAVVEEPGPRFDAVAVVQCTSPFALPEDLAGAVRMLERTRAPSVVSVVRVENALHPLKLKVLEGDRLLPYLADDALAPSDELPPLWRRNGAVYVSRREVLDGGRLVGDDVRGYEMPPERSLDVDTPLDLAFARYLLETRDYTRPR